MEKDIQLIGGDELIKLRKRVAKSNKKYSQDQYIKALTKENDELKDNLVKYRCILKYMLIHSEGSNVYKN